MLTHHKTKQPFKDQQLNQKARQKPFLTNIQIILARNISKSPLEKVSKKRKPVKLGKAGLAAQMQRNSLRSPKKLKMPYVKNNSFRFSENDQSTNLVNEFFFKDLNQNCKKRIEYFSFDNNNDENAQQRKENQSFLNHGLQHEESKAKIKEDFLAEKKKLIQKSEIKIENLFPSLCLSSIKKPKKHPFEKMSIFQFQIKSQIR